MGQIKIVYAEAQNFCHKIRPVATAAETSVLQPMDRDPNGIVATFQSKRALREGTLVSPLVFPCFSTCNSKCGHILNCRDFTFAFWTDPEHLECLSSSFALLDEELRGAVSGLHSAFQNGLPENSLFPSLRPCRLLSISNLRCPS